MSTEAGHGSENSTSQMLRADHLTASVEFTSVVNADRLALDTYTAEAALVYLVTPTTQIDLGGFVGLNRAAPDFQVAAGVVHRF